MTNFTILVSTVDPSGFTHWQIRGLFEDGNEDEILQDLKRVYRHITEGKETFVRCYPEVTSERLHDRIVTQQKAFARFSMSGQPGSEIQPQEPTADYSLNTPSPHCARD